MSDEAGTRRNQRAARLLLIVVGVLLVIGVVAWLLRPGELLLQGQIDVTEINVSAKVPGRIENVLVQEGAKVERGQLLATLATPEVRAKAAQATALVDAARALEEKAVIGARPEDINAAKMQWEAAQQAADLARITYERVQRLNDEGVLPTQKRDEAYAQAKATQAQANAAQSIYLKARAGTRPEDLRAAKAKLAEAEGGRAEVEVYLDEREVRAPIGGEISTRVLEPGELAASGAPIVVIADMADMWASFNLREDRLAGVRIGREFDASIPALGNRQTRFRIDLISPLADFATWRSARDLGGFDLKTFEVRARPVEPVENLRPGMSVVLPASTFAVRD